ncbi:MAG: hypothetical protein ACOC5T_07265 [Elusimicrobiota bacterium]
MKDFFTYTATVKRQVVKTDDDGNKYSELTDEENEIEGHLQQASPERAETMKMDFTKTFIFWAGVDEDLNVGDTIEINSEDYSVKAIQKNEVGSNQHLEAIIQKE